MGGLDYLNKKVWHPGSMKNIQKVWEEQQKQRDINKKQKQRAKKLQEERHNEELKRIQVQAGLIPRSHLDRMQWMYDWGNKLQQQKTNQQYLTGQKKADPTARKQFKHVFQEQITNSKCEDFALLYEDPMFEIQRREKERRDAIVNNPIQMKKIIKEIETDYLPSVKEETRSEKHKKKSKKHKKDKKKDRKEKKSKKERKHSKRDESRNRNSSSSSSSSSSNSSSSSDSQRQRSRDKKRQKKDYKDEDSSTTSKNTHKQSDLYKEYLKQRFGGMLKKQQDGSLKVDYGIHKKKYRTQYQLDQDERRRRLEDLRNNATALKEERDGERRGNENYKEEKDEEQDYDKGVNNLRQKMYSTVKENRNLKQYKEEEYEQEC